MTRRTGAFAPPFALAFAACLAVIGTAVPASAQGLLWTDIAGPRGFSAIHELGDGTLFSIDGVLLQRSFDGGLSWEGFPRPGGPILEFAARGATVALAVQTSAAFYKQYFVSLDRGDSWTRVNAEGNPVHVNLMLSAGGELHALFPDGSKMAVERLIDGTWWRVGTPSGVLSNPTPATRAYTVSNLDDAGTIYIGSTADGIHSSRDGGWTWTKALPYRQVSSLAFGPGGIVSIGTTPNARTGGGVFTSTDRGAAWEFRGLTDLFMRGIGYNGAGDLLVLGTRVLGDPAAVYRLNAGAAVWDSLAPFEFDYGALHIAGSGKYIATSPGLGLLTSTDDGATWGTDGIRGREVYAIATGGDGSILAGTLGAGLFRTTDAGFRWFRVGGAGLPSSFYVLATLNGRIHAGTERGLFVSDDDGGTWTSLGGGLDSTEAWLPVYAVAAHPSSGLLIGTAAGVFRSSDGGTTWTPSGLAPSMIRALSTGADGTIWAATGAHGVFVSFDGGASWGSRGLVRSDLQTVGVGGSGVIYAGAAGGVFLSTDGGASWTRRTFTSGHVHALLFNGNFNIFAASSAGLFATTNGGQNWFSAGLDGRFVPAVAYDRFRSIVAALYGEGAARTAQFITPVEGGGEPLPAATGLAGNYPNPFNPATTIEYRVARSSRVTITVHDLLGRAVGIPVDGHHAPGTYRAEWDGSDRPSGVYFYSLTVAPDGAAAGDEGGAVREVRKMMLLR